MKRIAGVAVASWVLTGCFASHGLEGAPSGEPCGSVVCAEDEVCCNASCGICTPPGAGCITLACADAGASDAGPLCGGEQCGPGQICCAGCDGEFCSGPGGLCVDPVCPPDTCFGAEDCGADEFCRFLDEQSCGGEGVCESRPAGCRGGGLPTCGCDGAMYSSPCEAHLSGVDVAPLRSCPWEPPMGPCDFLSFCECEAAEACEPRVDLHQGCICSCDEPFNCSGETCDCDCAGAVYVGCGRREQCADPVINCEFGQTAVIGGGGCPVCVGDP